MALAGIKAQNRAIANRLAILNPLRVLLGLPPLQFEAVAAVKTQPNTLADAKRHGTALKLRKLRQDLEQQIDSTTIAVRELPKPAALGRESDSMNNKTLWIAIAIGAAIWFWRKNQ